MKKINCLLITLFGFVLCAIAQKKAPPPRQIPDQYIVVMKESAAKPVKKRQKKNEDREQKFNDNNTARQDNHRKLRDLRGRRKIREENVKNNYTDVLVGFSAKLSKEEAEALKNDPDVEGIYPDFEISFYVPEIKQITTPFEPGDCFLTTAGGPGNGANNGKWIWILDNGVDLDHPDLNVLTRYRNVDYAVSFVPDEPSPDATHPHGTMVAGIAAAKNNGFGITGVSAGAKVVPVKIAKGFIWQDSWLIAGLDHVAKYDAPGDVVNLSIGSSYISDCYRPSKTAILNLGNDGTFVCIAAGNEATNASFSYPGCLEGTRIVTVGAINCKQTCAGYSNLGPGVDYYAVGTNVTSCTLNGKYGTDSGTSYAAPVVAGILHLRGWPATGTQIKCKDWTKPIAMR